MPWSFWFACAVLAGTAIISGQGWWRWALAALAVAMIGIGIRAWTDGLHYKATHNKGEDHEGS